MRKVLTLHLVCQNNTRFAFHLLWCFKSVFHLWNVKCMRYSNKIQYDNEEVRILQLSTLFSFFLTFYRPSSPHPLSITFQSVVCCWIIEIQGLCWRPGSPTRKTRSRWWSLSLRPLFSLLASLYHLSHSLSLPLSLSLCSTAALGDIWIGPNLRNASSLVGMDLRNQMVRLFGAINSLRESVGTCLQQRFGGAQLNVLNDILP